MEGEFTYSALLYRTRLGQQVGGIRGAQCFRLAPPVASISSVRNGLFSEEVSAPCLRVVSSGYSTTIGVILHL